MKITFSFCEMGIDLDFLLTLNDNKNYSEAINRCTHKSDAPHS